MTIKNLSTGKSVKVVNRKLHDIEGCDFVDGGMVSGEKIQRFVGSFTQTGDFKVSVTVYHANKKIATANKTITVS
jgi:hypothetical protein